MSDRIQKWKRIKTETVLNKFNRKIQKVTFLMPNGKEADYYLREEGPGAGILAITKDKKVIVAKEYRPGPDKILYNLPGGFVDPGEDPEYAAKRELLEETGYTGNFNPVAVVFEDSYSNMKYYCYVATDCEKVQNATPEEDEIIEIELFSVEEFRKILKTGECNDTQIAYLGLDYLGLL